MTSDSIAHEGSGVSSHNGFRVTDSPFILNTGRLTADNPFRSFLIHQFSPRVPVKSGHGCARHLTPRLHHPSIVPDRPALHARLASRFTINYNPQLWGYIFALVENCSPLLTKAGDHEAPFVRSISAPPMPLNNVRYCKDGILALRSSHLRPGGVEDLYRDATRCGTRAMVMFVNIRVGER
ncbi:uncharacterized protein BDR25DRAFT_81959 [Lindgomyces ingoldianus]|uniref:Uncharacterized protein n=1 Tax=Lindgomyces ingoldianus TaxID=673940 RepID=A0ACB6QHM5_9PLEO|nr:uncharacterized protein BDR25DRAFT_81959 [Lindgomyces ingoldianus]KAF2466000.1 hypothetical protein BDR25DRAFT_81959 [Lindgomyces ingoldianus]